MSRQIAFHSGPFFLMLLAAGLGAASAASGVDTESHGNGGVSAAVEDFSEIVRSGDLTPLADILHENRFTFDETGALYEPVECFLHWRDACRTLAEQTIVQQVLNSDHFVYLYPRGEGSVIVNFVYEKSRTSFEADPWRFLENEYMSQYFSCHFIESDGQWRLTESVCNSETEGPFEPQPDL